MNKAGYIPIYSSLHFSPLQGCQSHAACYGRRSRCKRWLLSIWYSNKRGGATE